MDWVNNIAGQRGTLPKVNSVEAAMALLDKLVVLFRNRFDNAFLAGQRRHFPVYIQHILRGYP